MPVQRFWDRYKGMFPDTASDMKAGGGYSIWHNVPGTDLVISQWLSQKRVGLFVRGWAGVPTDSLAFPGKPGANLHPRGTGKAIHVSWSS